MKAPDGTPIVATPENIPGTCAVEFNADGTFWHLGGTNIDWDSQKTVLLAGQTVFIDENDNEWLQSQLIADDADELPAEQIKPWFHDRVLRRVEILKTVEALMDRVTGQKLKVKDCQYLTRAVTLLLDRSEPE
ncbi:MAG: hypothetical protein E5X41_17225 [Mesorhizobium sp.]|nr:MAG: hypothetical protein E5X41_17225 [Mesorhizobium sp.]